jgi:hypothetical protein
LLFGNFKLSLQACFFNFKVLVCSFNFTHSSIEFFDFLSSFMKLFILVSDNIL